MEPTIDELVTLIGEQTIALRFLRQELRETEDALAVQDAELADLRSTQEARDE